MVPSRPSRLGLWVGTGETRCKSPPRGGLRCGSSDRASSQRLYSQLLLARQITLLHALLALEQMLLRL
jgi:hypothetical protein